jgi:hypothetical protein
MRPQRTGPPLLRECPAFRTDPIPPDTPAARRGHFALDRPAKIGYIFGWIKVAAGFPPGFPRRSSLASNYPLGFVRRDGVNARQPPGNPAAFGGSPGLRQSSMALKKTPSPVGTRPTPSPPGRGLRQATPLGLNAPPPGAQQKIWVKISPSEMVLNLILLKPAATISNMKIQSGMLMTTKKKGARC